MHLRLCWTRRMGTTAATRATRLTTEFCCGTADIRACTRGRSNALRPRGHTRAKAQATPLRRPARQPSTMRRCERKCGWMEALCVRCVPELRQKSIARAAHLMDRTRGV
eukprot:5560389-Prymnesium_polylepis.2